MKHFLCLMGQLCPLSNQNITRLTAMVAVVTLFMCLLAVLQVSAQSEPAASAAVENIKPLQIGDTIPEELWHLPLQVVNHPEGKETITLNDYRGKLIILDFWGTFCSSCIAAMPKIDEVQRQFSEDMVVIPVSWSKPEATETTLKTHQSLSSLSLFSVVEAQQLIETFPHGVVPHYAWINSQGKVVATTATNDVTKDNIVKVLEGVEPDYALAKFVDSGKPLLFSLEDLPSGSELQHYAVLVKGRIPGLASKITSRESDGVVHGMLVSNRTLHSIYTTVAMISKGEHPGKRLIMVDKIEDTTLYNFDFILPLDSDRVLHTEILDFVNDNCDYHGKWIQRKRPCFVLTTYGGSHEFRSEITERTLERGRHFFSATNFPISHFVAWLNREDISGEKIVVNETDYGGPIDVELTHLNNIEQVRHQLQEIGLDLIDTERVIEVFEINKSTK